MLFINTNALQDYMFGERLYGYVGGEKTGYINYILATFILNNTSLSIYILAYIFRWMFVIDMSQLDSYKWIDKIQAIYIMFRF